MKTGSVLFGEYRFFQLNFIKILLYISIAYLLQIRQRATTTTGISAPTTPPGPWSPERASANRYGSLTLSALSHKYGIFRHPVHLLSQFCQFSFSSGQINNQNQRQHNIGSPADASPCRMLFKTKNAQFQKPFGEPFLEPIHKFPLQNGSWTRVQMSCVRDPSSGNVNGQRSADGGFLVGANGGLPGTVMQAATVTVTAVSALMCG